MKNSNKKKDTLRRSRIRRIRAAIAGTAERPRAAVRCSLRHTYVQLVNDETGTTVAAASDRELKAADAQKPVVLAHAIGKLAAERARAKQVAAVVLDRHGRKYHGRVKAVADGLREGGLAL